MENKYNDFLKKFNFDGMDADYFEKSIRANEVSMGIFRISAISAVLIDYMIEKFGLDAKEVESKIVKTEDLLIKQKAAEMAAQLKKED